MKENNEDFEKAYEKFRNRVVRPKGEVKKGCLTLLNIVRKLSDDFERHHIITEDYFKSILGEFREIYRDDETVLFGLLQEGRSMFIEHELGSDINRPYTKSINFEILSEHEVCDEKAYVPISNIFYEESLDSLDKHKSVLLIDRRFVRNGLTWEADSRSKLFLNAVDDFAKKIEQILNGNSSVLPLREGFGDDYRIISKELCVDDDMYSLEGAHVECSVHHERINEGADTTFFVQERVSYDSDDIKFKTFVIHVCKSSINYHSLSEHLLYGCLE